MSASRAFRRRLGEHRGKPKLFDVVGPFEVWLVDGVMHLLPILHDGMHREVKNALTMRRQASLSGRCACGARIKLDGPLTPGSTVHGRMEHEADCMASDVAIAELVERHGWSPA